MRRWTLSGMLVTSTVLFSGIVASGKVLQHSSLEGKIPQDVEDLYRDFLEQAQASARDNQLPQAMVAISGIPSNSLHHEIAQQLREQWSRDLLQVSRNHYSKAELKEAIALLKAVPPSSSSYSQAQLLQMKWANQLKLLERAEQAFGSRNWGQTVRILEPLQNSEMYRAPKVQAVLQHSVMAMNSADSIAELSDPDWVMPAQLTAAAPAPVQIQTGETVELSPIAMSIDEAMSISEQSTRSPAVPEAPIQSSPEFSIAHSPQAQPVVEPASDLEMDHLTEPTLSELPSAQTVALAEIPDVEPPGDSSLLKEGATCLSTPEFSATPAFTPGPGRSQEAAQLPMMATYVASRPTEVSCNFAQY
jgi:hypothetical protein